MSITTLSDFKLALTAEYDDLTIVQALAIGLASGRKLQEQVPGVQFRLIALHNDGRRKPMDEASLAELDRYIKDRPETFSINWNSP